MDFVGKKIGSEMVFSNAVFVADYEYDIHLLFIFEEV
jgi:hypothetical protein